MEIDDPSCRAFICSALGHVASHFAHGPPHAFELARLQSPALAHCRPISNNHERYITSNGPTIFVYVPLSHPVFTSHDISKVHSQEFDQVLSVPLVMCGNISMMASVQFFSLAC
jgi:hypothetical protein